MRIVLASGSPRRRELLGRLVDAFGVMPSDIPEALSGNAVRDAVTLAVAKAEAVARREPRATAVIGADTIVFDEERSYGKPADEAEARSMLRALRGRPHRVVTGVAVVARGAVQSGHAVATVSMAGLADDVIDDYVLSGRPLDKAGGYAIQDEDVHPVDRLDGCYCCVVGLPLWLLLRLLRGAGLTCRAPDAALARCAACPDRGAG